MLHLILTGAIALIVLCLYILINRPGLALRALSIARKRSSSGGRIYLEYFREHKRSRVSRNIVVQALPWVMVIALFFLLGSQYVIFALVSSGSMEPTFKKGDLVLMQTVDKTARGRDIVMFGSYGIREPIVHRVVGFTSTGLIVTKGDANNDIDREFLPQERIGGKAVLIGGNPIVLKGLGYNIRPENIGPYTVLTKAPKSFVIAQAFQRFQAVQPFVIFFATIFYFFILLESRMESGRKFNNRGRNGRKGKKAT